MLYKYLGELRCFTLKKQLNICPIFIARYKAASNYYFKTLTRYRSSQHFKYDYK